MTFHYVFVDDWWKKLLAALFTLHMSTYYLTFIII